MEKKTGADVAADALAFGKKIVIGYLIAGGILFLVGAACVLPWMISGLSRLQAQNDQVRAQIQQQVSATYDANGIEVTHYGER